MKHFEIRISEEDLEAQLEQAKAEGAAEERAKHQADCERALLEMEESVTRREREACAKWLTDWWAEWQQGGRTGFNLVDAFRARGGKS